MTKEELIEDIETAIELEKSYGCACDPEVGFTCESCFMVATLESAKAHLSDMETK